MQGELECNLVDVAPPKAISSCRTQGWQSISTSTIGETIYGLSKQTLEARRRQEAISKGEDYKPLTKEEFLGISQDDVMREYRGYWDRSGAGKLPPTLGYYHFDWAIQDGEVDAIRKLQRAVGADVDGILGWDTLDKVRAMPIEETLKIYDDTRKRHRAGQSPGERLRFGPGWAARDFRAFSRAREMNQHRE